MSLLQAGPEVTTWFGLFALLISSVSGVAVAWLNSRVNDLRDENERLKHENEQIPIMNAEIKQLRSELEEVRIENAKLRRQFDEEIL